MSFDDYAAYITQKYRLSTAIAIIKSKPNNLTTEQYLNQLKNTIKIKMADDFDISICSNDFDVDSENDMNVSETILRDINFENDIFNVCNDKYVDGSILECPQLPASYIPENLTQTTYYETPISNPITQSQFNPIIEQDVDATYCNTVDIQNNTPNNIGDKDCFTDTQKTILYTVHGFTQNTHYSPSQNNLTIPKQLIYAINNNTNIIKGRVTNSNDINVTSYLQTGNNVDDITINHPNTEKTDVNNERMMIVDTYRDTQNPSDPNDHQNTWNIMKYASDDSHNTNYTGVVNDNEKERTKEACESIVTLNVDLPNTYKHNKDANILQNVFYEKQNTNQREVIVDNNDKSIQITFNNERITSDSTNIIKNASQRQITEDINIFSQTLDQNNIEDVIKDNGETTRSLDDNTSDFNYIDNTITINNTKTKQKFLMTNGINDLTELVPILTDATVENSQNTDIFSPNDEIYNETQQIELNNERQVIHLIENGTQEVIPFKILEEFNKVKSFLSRNDRRMSCDGYSSDSGYRSDSQGRSNKSALQLSGNWLNQSGHSLFDYIMSCHLVVSTRDITNEIAHVLGKLIDKLHDDEKYPSFLEAILEANNVLLRRLYEGANSSEHVLLNRDENIQRLVLLNKSVHIQKYCIEKITNILTDYHSKLTDSETIYELTNIDQIENICYIFHLLEILLKKYNKSKDLLSQASTQPSQDDGILKKSSITDLWKRKWNPKYQDGGVEAGSSQKTCVLKLCCEVLNKIIVDNLNSYSLVSYAALKCFNLTQS